MHHLGPAPAHAPGRDGALLDTVHKHKPSALDAAVVSGEDRELWPEGTHEVPGDEVIHVRPKQLDPKAEVRQRSLHRRRMGIAGVKINCILY
jgi:hypothetical protein